MLIPMDQLKVESSAPSLPPGGQHVGLGPTGIKVTHLPTGVVAICEACRSQHRNRAVAISMIEAAITHPEIGR